MCFKFVSDGEIYTTFGVLSGTCVQFFDTFDWACKNPISVIP